MIFLIEIYFLRHSDNMEGSKKFVIIMVNLRI